MGKKNNNRGIKMKLYASIAVMLLLLAAQATAATLIVDDIRGYVNNERVSNVDENGGDFDAKPGDTLDLIVRLKNNENATVQAKLVGTIELIDSNSDITQTHDFYDISSNDDKSKTLSFTIPSGARDDEFDMELKITEKLGNGTEQTNKGIDYNVIIDKDVPVTEASINDVLMNLSATCNNIAATTNTCFGYISTATNCTSELSTVKEERGTYQTQATECSEIKAELEREKIQLQNQLDNSISVEKCNEQASAATDAVRQDSQKRFNQTLSIAGLGAAGYWYFQKRKKSRVATSSSYDSEYFGRQ